MDVETLVVPIHWHVQKTHVQQIPRLKPSLVLIDTP